MSEATPLEAEIRRRITIAGPMPVGEYMALCLSDPRYGYYTTGDPLGARGDFITAPEVSQMFGELIGLWLALVWQQMGKPENIRVVELGPGRGTLLNDGMRAARIVEGFSEAVVLHLVEINPVLQARQGAVLRPLGLPVYWHPSLADVPGGPALIVANEFFDALPVNQAVKTEDGWHERQVEVDAAGHLAFTHAPQPLPQFERLLPEAVRQAPVHSIFEWRNDAPIIEIGRRVARDGGVALVIDYGHGESAVGDTLQAVDRHTFADPLTRPGAIDVTAHVDFAALAAAAEAMGANAQGPIAQSLLLRRLGIEARANTLKLNAEPAVAADIDAALERLTGTDRAAMGVLFKAMAIAAPRLGVPPGFEG